MPNAKQLHESQDWPLASDDFLLGGDIGLVTFGVDLRIRGISSAAKAYLGLDSSCIGSEIECVSRAIGDSTLSELAKSVVAASSSVRSEVANREGVPNVMHLFRLETGGGADQRIAMVLLDARASKRARDLIHDSEMRLNSILESTVEGIYGQDLDGNCIFCNRACVEVLGYREPGELLGRNMHDLVHHTHPDGSAYAREDCPICANMRDGSSIRVTDEVLWRSNGSSFPVEYSSRPLLMGGEVTGAAVVFHDISERVALMEESKRYAKQLAGMARELDEFSYMASHDLQEPLRKVAACCQVLEQDYGNVLDAQGKEWLRLAVDGARRMSKLINDLLLYSRQGRRETDLSSIDASAACRMAIENIQTAIDECGAQILVGPLPAVRANQTELVQLFQNLIGNAIKYRELSRPLTIEIGAEPMASEWRFFVRDNGIGIAPEYQQRIFAIFRRLHGHDERGGGTGIGLAIAKKNVERFGGRIWVESKLGSGATFYFTLPQMVGA